LQDAYLEYPAAGITEFNLFINQLKYSIMPVNIPDQLPAIELLKQENIFV